MQNSIQFSEKPHAILFDLDHTLYDYDITHQKALDETTQKAQQLLGISQNDFIKAFELARHQIKERLKGTAAEHNRLLYFQKTLENLNMKTQPLLALDLEQTYWHSFLLAIELFDGVEALLSEIKALGVPTAIVTDLTAQIQFRKITYLKLDRYFDFIVSSEEAGCEKPNTLPFKIALEKLSNPKNPIWMIGDHTEKDIVGAKNAIGALTLQRSHAALTMHQRIADFTFTHFDEITQLIKKYE